MRIQYLSDVHLEFGDCELPSTDADILIAAGDIHTGTSALKWLSQSSCPVIYIAGNHEYYGGDLVHTLAALRIQSKVFDIHFLENDAITLEDTRFLGTTLWTDFDNANEKIIEYAKFNMNDYNFIKNNRYLLNPEDLLQIHRESKNWLEQELKKPFHGKTVVITHHAPTLDSWHDDPDSERRYTYCSDLQKFMGKNDIDLWLHGHVHHVSDYIVNNVRVVCNPRGYYAYKEVSDFASEKTIEL
jgi:DNA repair exonuclease SbcCD nuclease subunit